MRIEDPELELTFRGDTSPVIDADWMKLVINGVAWLDLATVVKEVPVRKLLRQLMIRHWPEHAKVIFTDYVFLYCGEPIAVKIVYDRETRMAVLTAAVGNNQFFYDSEKDCIVIVMEKPLTTEIDGVELGQDGAPFKMTLGIETTAGTLKITCLYSHIEKNFSLSANFVPFRLMVTADKAASQGSAAKEAELLECDDLSLSLIHI